MNHPIMAIQHLQRSIDKVPIIKGISANVYPGDVIALLGKNGAGKTTLMETLLGFCYPTEGSVHVCGAPATDMTAATKARIGFVPQQSELITHLSVADHLRLFREFRAHWNQPLVDKRVSEWGLPLTQQVGKLSVGQQQKLSILLAIAHNPELLVLDEPVASLDPIARRQFLQQVIELAADGGRAIIFSTHIISDVERVANQVWMLRQGVLAYQGDLDTLKESVARVTCRINHPVPQTVSMPSLINQRIQGQTVILTFTQWTPELEKTLQQQYSSNIQVEFLSLEDIFLEMNHE